MNSANTDAWTRRLLEHAPTIDRVARELTSSRHEADEVYQLALIKAWTSPPADQTNLHAWLRRVVASVVIDCSRRRRSEERRMARLRDSLGAHVAESTHTVGNELRGALSTALEELPQELRATINLRFDDGLSFLQIASALGVPESTVRSRLRRALAQLQQKLQPIARENWPTWSAPLLVPVGLLRIVRARWAARREAEAGVRSGWRFHAARAVMLVASAVVIFVPAATKPIDGETDVAARNATSSHSTLPTRASFGRGNASGEMMHDARRPAETSASPLSLEPEPPSRAALGPVGGEGLPPPPTSAVDQALRAAGLVVNQYDEPVEGASVFSWAPNRDYPKEPERYIWTMALSNSAGGVEIPVAGDSPGGKPSLIARGPEPADRWLGSTLETWTSRTCSFLVRLEECPLPTTRARLEVLDTRSGQAVLASGITIQWEGDSPPMPKPPDNAIHIATGAVEIDRIHHGEWSVWIDAPGFGVFPANITVTGHRELISLRCLLTPIGSIMGRLEPVQDFVSHERFVDAEITDGSLRYRTQDNPEVVGDSSSRPGGVWHASVRVAPDGRFSITNLIPGPYRLSLAGEPAVKCQTSVEGGRECSVVLRR